MSARRFAKCSVMTTDVTTLAPSVEYFNDATLDELGIRGTPRFSTPEFRSLFIPMSRILYIAGQDQWPSPALTTEGS